MASGTAHCAKNPVSLRTRYGTWRSDDGGPRSCIGVRVDLQSGESGSRLNDFDSIFIINECVLPVYQFSSVVQLSYF